MAIINIKFLPVLGPQAIEIGETQILFLTHETEERERKKNEYRASAVDAGVLGKHDRLRLARIGSEVTRDMLAVRDSDQLSDHVTSRPELEVEHQRHLCVRVR